MIQNGATVRRGERRVVLYASRPASRAKFTTSAWGDLLINERGELCWQADRNRRRAFAYVQDSEAVRAEITELMLHEPVQRDPVTTQ